MFKKYFGDILIILTLSMFFMLSSSAVKAEEEKPGQYLVLHNDPMLHKNLATQWVWTKIKAIKMMITITENDMTGGYETQQLFEYYVKVGDVVQVKYQVFKVNFIEKYSDFYIYEIDNNLKS